MAEQLPQNPEQQYDLLEKLLAGAAEREARKVTEEKLQKGTVTKSEFGSALVEFEARLGEKIESALAGIMTQKASPAPTEEEEESEGEPVKKAGRKGTISSAPSDSRSDNPVKYLLQKSRSKTEDFDDLDKALVWELTRKGFLQGMSTQEIDGPDFGDEY